MIKALIFDFDGLIIDTEMPDFESWQMVYRQFNCELAVEEWGQIVGGTGGSDFDPHTNLEKLSGQKLDREQIWVQRRTQYLDSVAEQPILPGVIDYLDEANRRGLGLAVASSSPENWVHGHLSRLGLLEHFDVIRTADDVERTKPAPDLFLAALEGLGVAADEAIVFEDSPNGVRAAQAAGIYVVMVPNPFTAQLAPIEADLKLKSLGDMQLRDLLELAEA